MANINILAYTLHIIESIVCSVSNQKQLLENLQMMLWCCKWFTEERFGFTTPPRHFLHWCVCTKPGKWVIMNLCVRVSILPTFLWFFYWVLELVRQCGIFCFSFNYLIFHLLSQCKSFCQIADDQTARAVTDDHQQYSTLTCYNSSHLDIN